MIAAAYRMQDLVQCYDDLGTADVSEYMDSAQDTLEPQSNSSRHESLEMQRHSYVVFR